MGEEGLAKQLSPRQWPWNPGAVMPTSSRKEVGWPRAKMENVFWQPVLPIARALPEPTGIDFCPFISFLVLHIRSVTARWSSSGGEGNHYCSFVAIAVRALGFKPASYSRALFH